ncbi:uncharacterized protein N7483_004917 [Penicillium malachiteum]|uniref:uncharacterized protein n=1 Tax=Penicillium malachiteum TaxID=1324776 RepID=UPI002547F733|nr:uncharacterized protein N7483_004917 [Penicillium malachiteum]KAJ5730409.1 hypothetical protein N7483_004917 [Penicillium malachiteum]
MSGGSVSCHGGARYAHIFPGRYFTIINKVDQLRTNFNDALANVEGIPELYAKTFEDVLGHAGQGLANFDKSNGAI